ncbi:MAG: hypothetical protein O3C21_18280 [Verrucomicrobia bacterium]|nr:hypothetical protein [Verrucomicrobiota bacterium]
MPKLSVRSSALCLTLTFVISSCAGPSSRSGSALFNQLSPTSLKTGVVPTANGNPMSLQWHGRDEIELADFDRAVSADTLNERDFPGWVTQMGVGEPGLLYRSKRADELYVSELGSALPVTLIEKGGALYVCDVLDDDQLAGQQLAANFTAPLAFLRQQGNLHLPVIKAMLRSGDYLKETGLYRFEPVDPDRIPVVFVHGLKSSPSIWKIMVNELRRDPVIRKRYQFWSFSYPTGLPILYSAKLLRDDLNAIEEQFNPQGNHPAWEKMVLVGQSMGGLVARLQVTDSGNAFWESSAPGQAGVELDTVPSPIIRDSVVFKHLPYVSRIVFMATPHGGSEVAVSKLGLITSKLIQIPANLTQIVTDMVKINGPVNPELIEIPTSIDSLNPDSPFIRTLKTLPISPGIPYHSIIASGRVANTSPEMMNDGLVTYASASLKGARSETIVASGHRAPNHPDAVTEVTRILREHLRLTQRD